MPASWSFRVVGVEALIQRFQHPPVVNWIQAESIALMNEVKRRVEQYPPETDANRPTGVPGGRWYQRLWGPRWVTKMGVHGRYSSEKLKYSWRVSASGRMGAKLSSKASYAHYVQGDKQTAVMQRIGWHTVREIIDSMRAGGELVSRYRTEVRRWLVGR